MGICPVNIVASQDVRLVAIPAANVRSEESPLFERLSKKHHGRDEQEGGPAYREALDAFRKRAFARA